MQVLYMIKKNIAGYFLLLMTILFMMQVVAFAESGRPYRKSAVHKGNLVKTKQFMEIGALWASLLKKDPVGPGFMRTMDTSGMLVH